MKFLLVSDVHKSLKYRELGAVDWLLGIIDEVKADVLISAGDWDEGMSDYDFQRIISKVKMFTVYGNHENFSIITRYAIPDGKVFEVGVLKIAGINGLIGDGKKVYEITPNKFSRIVKRLKGTVIDILVTHQPPYLPEAYPYMEYDEAGRMMLEAIETLRPKLFFNGHMKGGCYTFYEFPFKTKYFRVDSSQSYKCYAVLEGEEVKVFEDGEEVFKFNV